MSYEQLQIWVDVAQFLVTGGVAVYIYLVNKNAATEGRILQAEQKIDGRLDDHETRLARVEANQQHAIDHDDLGAVYKEISATRQAVENMSGQMKQLVNQVDRINDHLLSSKT